MNIENTETIVSPASEDIAGLEIKKAKRLQGMVSLPGDAHMTLLAVGLAALCEEPTQLENVSEASWFQEFRTALESMGVVFDLRNGHGSVRGGALHAPAEAITVNHDLAALILAGIGSGLGLDLRMHFNSERISRDIPVLLDSILQAKGKNISRPFDRGWNDALAKIPLIFHHLAAHQALELQLRRPGCDLLENLLPRFGVEIRVEREDKDGDELTRRIARQMRAAGGDEPVTKIRLPAVKNMQGASLTLPGDAGEAGFLALAATLIKNSDVTLENVLLNVGRSGFLSALRRMGADVDADRRERQGEAVGNVRIRSGGLFGKRFDAEALETMRDEVFPLMAAAAFADGESVFRDLEFLGAEADDRLKAFIAALKRVGVEIGEFEDGIVIRGKPECDAGAYDSLGHPGLAAAFTALALKSHGVSTLVGSEDLEWRFPALLKRIEMLGHGEKEA